MSARFDADGDMMSRTTNLMPIATFTVMAWVRLAVNTGGFTPMLAFGNTPAAANYYLISTDGTGTDVILFNGAVLTSVGATLVVGVWAHLAMVIAGSGVGQALLYVNGVLAATGDGRAANTAVEVDFGNNGATGDGEYFNGAMAAAKCYDVALSAAEVATERRQYAPVRTSNLNSFYPMLTGASAATDFSGSLRTATVVGSLVTEDGPPVPWSLPLAAQDHMRRQSPPRAALQRASNW